MRCEKELTRPDVIGIKSLPEVSQGHSNLLQSSRPIGKYETIRRA